MAGQLFGRSGQGLFFIPLILLLPSWFGLQGVEMCQAVSDILTFVFTIPIMTYTFKEFAREQQAVKISADHSPSIEI